MTGGYATTAHDRYVDDQKVGVILRMARIRKNKRQCDVAADAGISAAAVARHERVDLAAVTHRALRQHAHAVGIRLELERRGPASDVLRDDEHAAVVDHLKRWLESMGWETVVEASYSEYGERGRIDLLAHHAGLRVILVVEVKTAVIDAQGLFGSIDVKERLARTLAAKRGWRPQSAGVLLAVTRTNTNERKIARLAGLFGAFRLRGAAARAWLNEPSGDARMLLFVSPTEVGRNTWRNSRQRVRRSADRSPKHLR